MAKLSKRGYICYLRNPEQHTNAASSHAGWGRTPDEAREAACYYNNQAPWTTTARADRAPKWAQEEWNRFVEQEG